MRHPSSSSPPFSARPGASLWADALLLCGLAVAGAIYHAAFYDVGFNPGDEGSVALIAKMLAAGAVPEQDIRFGYGVLWFLPVALLFEHFEAGFLVMKGFFHGLGVCAALLGYALVRWTTASRWLALACGALIVLMPGTIHKTFIPFLPMVNVLCMAAMLGRGPRAFLGVAALYGVVNGASLHVRADITLVMTCLFFAMVTAELAVGERWRGRKLLPRGGVLVGVGALLAAGHALVFWSVSAGYGAHLEARMLQQYERPASIVRNMVAPFFAGASLLEARPALANEAPDIASGENATAVRHALGLPDLREAFAPGGEPLFVALTYAPLVVFAIFPLVTRMRSSAGAGVFRTSCTERRIMEGLLFGMALSVYPQFLLFRPDAAHLSQFMPPFLVLCAYLGARGWRLAFHAGWCWRRAAGGATVVLAGGLAMAWLVFGMQREGVGSIAKAAGRTETLSGAHGLHVRLTPWEHAAYGELTMLIQEKTAPDDCVQCFPFCPGVNVLAARATCLPELYFDGGLSEARQRRMVKDLEQARSAMVLYNDWAIHGTEASRFSNWADQVMMLLRRDFVPLGERGGYHVYLRADHADAPPAGPFDSAASTASPAANVSPAARGAGADSLR